MSRNINKHVNLIYSTIQSGVSQSCNKYGRNPLRTALDWDLGSDYSVMIWVFLAKVVGFSDKVVAPKASPFLDPMLDSLKQEISKEHKVIFVAIRGIQIGFSKRYMTDLESYVGNLVPTIDFVDGLLLTSTDIEYG